MKAYSPSSTMKYQICPRLKDLGDRWEAKTYQWTPNMLLGTAVALGLEYYFKGASEQDCLAEMDAKIVFEMPLGLEVEWSAQAVYKLAVGGYRAAIKTGLPLGGKVLEVEGDIAGAGRKIRRPDLVYRSESGEIVVIDHKVTMSFGADASRAAVYRNMRAAEWQDNWQAADYAWHVGQQYGQVVSKVGMHLIELQPKPRASLHWAEFTEERLNSWFGQAQAWWDRMYDEEHSVTIQYPQNWSACHNNKFASDKKCFFHAGCHDLGGDEKLFEALYKKRPPREIKGEENG